MPDSDSSGGSSTAQEKAAKAVENLAEAYAGQALAGAGLASILGGGEAVQDLIGGSIFSQGVSMFVGGVLDNVSLVADNIAAACVGGDENGSGGNSGEITATSSSNEIVILAGSLLKNSTMENDVTQAASRIMTQSNAVLDLMVADSILAAQASFHFLAEVLRREADLRRDSALRYRARARTASLRAAGQRLLEVAQSLRVAGDRTLTLEPRFAATTLATGAAVAGERALLEQVGVAAEEYLRLRGQLIRADFGVDGVYQFPERQDSTVSLQMRRAARFKMSYDAEKHIFG